MNVHARVLQQRAHRCRYSVALHGLKHLQVRTSDDIDIRAEVPRFVCRGGLKLEAALEAFGISVAGRVALDAGVSTGGFTDCLLQHGAARVFGVDVGYGQVADKVCTMWHVVRAKVSFNLPAYAPRADIDMPAL